MVKDKKDNLSASEVSEERSIAAVEAAVAEGTEEASVDSAEGSSNLWDGGDATPIKEEVAEMDAASLESGKEAVQEAIEESSAPEEVKEEEQITPAEEITKIVSPAPDMAAIEQVALSSSPISRKDLSTRTR